MTIEEALLKEHSKKQAELIARMAINSEIALKNLVKIYLSSDQKLAQRAAWAITHAVSKKPEIILPFLHQIIKHLHSPGLHDAVIRNGTKILEMIDIPVKHLGIATDLCFKLLSDPTVAIAARCYVMTALCNIMKKEPELRHELKLVIESQLPFASAGFRSRSKKTFKIINNMND